MDKLVIGTAADDTVRLIAAVTTDLVAEALRRHQTSPTASAALGRTLTGAALLGASLKEFDRLTVRVEADGPIQGIVAEAKSDGSVRGYVRNPAAELPPKPDGKFDVGGIIGGGMLYVTRESGFDLGLYREPYVGSVPITSGEIAEDLAYYLAKSEQIPSAVLLGVLLQNTAPFVAASGGVMIQMMPGVNDHLVTMIEDTVGRAPHVTTVIKEGATPEDLIAVALGEVEFKILDERSVRFDCSCSYERAVTMIGALGQDEVSSMLAEDGGAVMTCGFCNETYRLNDSALEAILAQEYGGTSDG
ncbi:MAG: Hsp33 family molecular chaperone HslO [Blastocatellia bacterium]|nr:Hsp33 family molecular chaperone HslO [Blastocatellia bacterium]